MPGPYRYTRRAPAPDSHNAPLTPPPFRSGGQPASHGPFVADVDFFGHYAASSLTADRAVLVYFDTNTQAWVPVGGAEVDWTERNNYEGRDYPAGSSISDADGSFDVPCSWDQNVSMLGSVILGSLAGPVYFGNTPSAANFEEQPLSCGTDYGMIGVQSEMGRVYDNMNRIVAASQSATGHSRGSLAVVIDLNATISAFQTGVSFYGYTEKVTINDNSQSPNRAVWGDYGDFTAAHEWGHAVHQDALGGIYGNICSGSHSLDATNTFGCAWREGFADYHAALVLAGQPNVYADYIRNGSGTGLSDSPLRESAVGAFLYRVTTASSGGLNYGGYYVTESLRVCRLAGAHVDGIDYMSYCLANSIDATGASNFAGFRGFTASGSVSNATTLPSGWSAAAVQQRRLTDLAH